MNKKLTKREKVLLYVLICFLILMGGIFWLILPAMDTLLERQARYQEVQEEYLLTRTAIDGISGVQEQTARIQENIAAMDGYYYPPMTTEQVDTLVTGLVRIYGLTPVSLSLSDPEPTALAYFGEKRSTTAAGVLLCCEAVLQLSGTAENAIALLDGIAGMTSLKVSDLQMINRLAENGASNYSLSLQVYMVLPLEEDTAE